MMAIIRDITMDRELELATDILNLIEKHNEATNDIKKFFILQDLEYKADELQSRIRYRKDNVEGNIRH